MKKFNNTVFIIAILLTLIIIAINIKQKQREKDILANYRKIEKQIYLNEESNAKLKEFIKNQISTQDAVFLIDSLLDIKTGQKIKLRTLLVNDPKLVMRYTFKDCQSCVDSTFLKISQKINEIGVENFLVITTPENIRELGIYIRTYKVNFHIYVTDIVKIPNVFSEAMTPYLFVLRPNLQMTNVFHFSVETANLFDFYLDNVIDRFSNTNIRNDELLLSN